MTPREEPCLTDDELSQFAEGGLSPERVRAVEAHVLACDACLGLVSGVAHAVSDTRSPKLDRDGSFSLRHSDPLNYELGPEIARGGMGRIRKAFDLRHRRVVAIKFLLHKDAAFVARFTREAQVTAQLQHPSIVPVHEAGVWPGDEPFVVMKFVAGTSLDKAIAVAKTFPERLAFLPNVIAIVDAVAYAHGEGVVHRDIKPGNVLVGAYGETVLIDWGLAKLYGSPEAPAPPTVGCSDDEVALTLAGHALGTPGYMAPEQARGENTQPTADVYSLGALLYYALTGRAPHSGKSSDEVVAQLLRGPPDRILALVPDLAPDLATIVEKAMARDPADRYPSASAMVEDLKRYEAGQRVASHRYSLALLARRFLSRHRAAVAVAATMLLAFAVGSVVVVHRIVQERDRADRLKDVAETRRAAAEELTGFMVGDLRSRLGTVGRLDLLSGVAGEVEKYYRSVAAFEDGTNLASTDRRAAALEAMADVDIAKADYDPARALAREAIELRERAARQYLRDERGRAPIAEGYLRLGAIEASSSRPDEAMTAIRTAVGLAEALLAADPSSRRAELLLASARSDLAAQLSARSDYDAELTARRAVRDALLRRVAADPNDLEVKRKLGQTYALISTVEVLMGKYGDAVASSSAGIQQWDDLLARDPKDVIAAAGHAEGDRVLGSAYNAFGDVQKGLLLEEKCVSEMDALVALDPGNADWADRLGKCLGKLTDLAIILQRYPEARGAVGRSLGILQAELARHPDNERAIGDLALTYRRAGSIEMEEGKGNYPAAIDQLKHALSYLDGLLGRDPKRIGWQRDRLLVLQGLAEVELETKQFDAALGHSREAEKVLNARVEQSPNDEGIVGRRGYLRAQLGRVLVALENYVEAEHVFEEALADFARSSKTDGQVNSQWLDQALRSAHELARLYVRDGHPDKARECVVAAIEMGRKADAAKRMTDDARGRQKELVAQLASLDQAR